jgi:uncharacterized cupredoxin-like copper-binding protein
MLNAIRSIALVSTLASPVLLGSAAIVQQGALAHSNGHEFTAGEPGDPTEAARLVEIVMDEGPGRMTYAPDRIEVRKGEQIRFVLKNVGALRHEFLIDTFANNAKHKLEMEKTPDMHHEEANGRHVEPKRTAELVWRFTKSGTFEIACLIPGHYEAGMKGVVVVK